MLIPEKILKNWNWTPHQVSFVAFRYLEEAYRNSEPLDVSKSPDLYSILPNLLSAQKAKEKLLQIGAIILTLLTGRVVSCMQDSP